MVLHLLGTPSEGVQMGSAIEHLPGTHPPGPVRFWRCGLAGDHMPSMYQALVSIPNSEKTILVKDHFGHSSTVFFSFSTAFKPGFNIYCNTIEIHLCCYILFPYVERKRESWNQGVCVKISKQQSWFSPSILQVPGLKVRQPSLTASSFHCQVLSLAQHAVVALLGGALFIGFVCVPAHICRS